MRLAIPKSPVLRGALIAFAAIVAGCFIYAWRPAIAEIERPDPTSFPLAQVKHGEALAQMGNCASCHTVARQAPFAGGRALPSPYGTFYGPNITPDPETGIGRWSLAAFRRALRNGVARDGAHLYPALPYVHFAHLSDADVAALYAYVMTREAIHATAPRNTFVPPLGFRPLLAGWKLLFFHPKPLVSEGGHEAAWYRGQYLAEGVAHCQSCHTPLGHIGREKSEDAYAGGGLAGGWVAPALDGSSACTPQWTVTRIEAFLRTGHGPCMARAAAGPMAEVVANLAHAPPADVHALAVYIASRMGKVA